MTYKKRVETLRVLAAGHQILSTSAKLPAIYGEFNRIASAKRRGTPEGWLLAVLHTTRALDTALSELLHGKRWYIESKSLGGYLKELENRSVLTSSERMVYQNDLVKKRNKYMHEAGAMPQNLDSDCILADMHACFVAVISRI